MMSIIFSDVEEGGRVMVDKRKIKVTINDQQYIIVSDDEPQHVRHVAQIVDDRFRDISNKTTGLDTNKKAILTAINIAHDYVKLQEQYDALVESQRDGNA